MRETFKKSCSQLPANKILLGMALLIICKHTIPAHSYQDTSRCFCFRAAQRRAKPTFECSCKISWLGLPGLNNLFHVSKTSLNCSHIQKLPKLLLWMGGGVLQFSVLCGAVLELGWCKTILVFVTFLMSGVLLESGVRTRP